MNVFEIIKTHLREHGADGLCRENCGCGIDDLCPGCHNEIPLDCVVAIRKIATSEDVYPDVDFEIGDVIYVPIKVDK